MNGGGAAGPGSGPTGGWGAGQLPFVLAGMFLMTLQPILVTLSQNSEGKLDYNPVISTLLAEACKAAISAGLLHTSQGCGAAKLRGGRTLQYAVPAAIYFVNNNLVFLILEQVGPTTFQLLSQLKIAFTAVLFRLFLRRPLTRMQWIALWQLTCGAAVSQIPSRSTQDSGGDSGSAHYGVLLSVISCFLSSCGGIYSEKLLKDDNSDSIHWQNIQLYVWGLLFNIAGACIHDPAVFQHGWFRGFNGWAFAVVANNALNGLAISAILKYADNIARVYAHAVAMLVTLVLSVLLFGHPPTPQLVLSVAIVGASAVQYNSRPDQPAQALQSHRPMELKPKGAQVVGKPQQLPAPSPASASNEEMGSLVSIREQVEHEEQWEQQQQQQQQQH